MSPVFERHCKIDGKKGSVWDRLGGPLEKLR